MCDDDRRRFKDWLGQASCRWNLSIVSYCLMTNHVHLAVVPTDLTGLHRVLKSAFTKFAMRLNSLNGWSGYVVQNRFFSSPLDHEHAQACVHYIEENPVRAKMVAKAEDYPWSSAYTRHRKIVDPLIDYNCSWYKDLVADREEAASQSSGILTPEIIDTFRVLNPKNLPIGNESFIKNLEIASGRNLRLRFRGRPKKIEK